MPVEEFTYDSGLDRPAICAAAFGYARDVKDAVQRVDTATKAIGANDTVTGTAIGRQTSAVEGQIKALTENPLVEKDDTVHGEALDRAREALSKLRKTLQILSDMSTRKDVIYETSREMRRHARLARSAWKTLSDREAAVQAGRLEVDNILFEEVRDLAQSLSQSLQQAVSADAMVAEADALRSDFEALTIPDCSGILIDLKTMRKNNPEAKTIPAKKSGDHIDAGKPSLPVEPPARMHSAKAQGDAQKRPGAPVKYEPPKKHVKFGLPLSPHEIERSSEQFFRYLWREGLPQARVADILFSKTARSEGLTVHDALSYSKGVDELYKSIDELKVKFIR